MRLLYGLVATALLLGGCSRNDSRQTTLSDPELTRQYRKDSVTVILSVSETNITTSGKIQMTIDVHTVPTSEVEFPELGDYIDPFTVADGYTEPIQTLPNGKHLHRRVWELVPSLPGNVVFQAMQLFAGETSISTEPICVQVTSLLPENLDAFEIKDIAELVTLLPEQKKKQQRGYILLGIAIALVFITILVKRLRRPATVPTLSAHEAAFLALENLPDDELPRIHALSELLIAFIGQRFRLPITGKTVGEIIPLLPKKKLLGRRLPLEKFLTSGEEIRFSNKVPAGFTDDLENYVRGFVEDVKEKPCA